MTVVTVVTVVAAVPPVSALAAFTFAVIITASVASDLASEFDVRHGDDVTLLRSTG